MFIKSFYNLKKFVTKESREIFFFGELGFNSFGLYGVRIIY